MTSDIWEREARKFCEIKGVSYVAYNRAFGVWYQTQQQIDEGLDRAYMAQWFEVKNVISDHEEKEI
jgi:hypothetical protein